MKEENKALKEKIKTMKKELIAIQTMTTVLLLIVVFCSYWVIQWVI